MNHNKNLNANELPFDVSSFSNKKYENSTLNGILKNSTTKLNGATNGQTKNITFGEIKH